MNDRPAKYVSNHDGDTATVILDQGFYDTKQINVRLANVWAPESDERGGPQVQQFVARWFATRALPAIKWPFVVTTFKTKTGSDLKTFDRYVANVTAVGDPNSLNSAVMKFIAEQGYSGGIGAPSEQPQKA